MRMRFGKFSLAAIAAASLVCAPVMARSLDSPVFTEKIEPKAVSSNIVAETKTSAQAQPAGMVIRFDPRMVHYAVLPPMARSTTSFDTYSVEFAAFDVQPTLNLAGDRYRALNTT